MPPILSIVRNDQRKYPQYIYMIMKIYYHFIIIFLHSITLRIACHGMRIKKNKRTCSNIQMIL